MNTYNSEMDSASLLLKDIRQISDLSNEDEKELLKEAKNNKKARDEIITHNLELVLFIAKKYSYGDNDYMSELFQEGCFGLFRAIENYNCDYNVKFSTYASFYIHDCIYKYIYAKKKSVMLPYHVLEDLMKFNKTYEKLVKKLNREPVIEDYMKELNFTYKKAETLYNYTRPEISLNQTISEEGTFEIIDTIESEEDIENTVIDECLKNDLNEVIKKINLNEKELFILEHSFGINNKEKLSMNQIGKKIGLSRERVRIIKANIEKKIIRKGKKVKGYVDDTETITNSYYIENNNVNYLKIKESIYELLNCSEEEKKEMLNDLSKNELEIFHKIFSTTLTNEEINEFYYNILNKIRNSIIKYRTKKVDSENSLMSKIDRSFLEEKLDEKSLKIALMMLGLYDGSCYSADYIANLFNISIDEIDDIYQKTLSLILPSK